MESEHVKPPKQPRSRRTLERLVEAANGLLDEGGLEAVTVQEVVARSGSSVGSFYARFDGRDELVSHLLARADTVVRETWRAAFDSRVMPTLELTGAVGEVTAVLSTVHGEPLGRLRVASAGSATDGYVAFRLAAITESAEHLSAFRAEIRHEDPELAVRLGLAAVWGVLEDPPAGPVDEALPRERLANECADLLLGYLTGSAGGAPGQVDYFDVWA